MDQPHAAAPSDVEAALRQSEARLRSLVESAVEGIITTDDHGLVQTFNPAAERLFGYAASEVIGHNVAMLMPSPDREQHDGYLAHHRATGERRIIGLGRQVVGRRKNGSTFPLHLSVGEMIVDGERSFTGILHDLSIRAAMEAALRKSEERLRSIVESAVDGIIVIDELGKIQAFNPAAERLFGYGANEVLDRNVKMLMPSPDRERHDGYIERYLTTGKHKIIGIGREVVALRKDGSTFLLHLSVGEMVLEGRRHFTGLLHDLTKRVELEHLLSEQKALAKLGEMAAVVAHEVKNPIAGIRGALQVITSRMPAEQRDRAILIDIIARLDALNRIVQDMLMFARPRALQKGPIAIEALVDETAALIRQDPGMAELNIRTSGIAEVTGDREMLQVVFQNILMNAAQAVSGKGTIEVSITTSDSTCRVEVIDQGPGMPQEVRGKAFDAFFTTKHRGTGLGLPIARRVVEAHGGAIHIDVPASGGTTVSVVLPLAR
jgi:two-component system, LuxR family, sensor kinase FixL